MGETRHGPTGLDRSLRAGSVILAAASAGWLLAWLVEASLVEVFPDFLLLFFRPTSAVLAGAAAIAARRRQRGMWLAALAGGAFLLIVCEVFFVEWVLIGGEEGTEIPVITSWSENHPGWTAETCVEQGTISPENLDSCWNHRRAVKLALALSYLLTLVGLGGVLGLLRLHPPRLRDEDLDERGYLDFDLWIEPNDPLGHPSSSEPRTYRVKASSRACGEIKSKCLFTVPKILRNIQEPVLRFGGAVRGGGEVKPVATNPESIGGELFEAVFGNEVFAGFKTSVATTRAHQGEGVRIRLHLSDDAPELANIPWEYLYDERTRDFLATSRRTPVVRYLEVPQPIDPLEVKPPLRILVMVSTPSDYQELTEAEEEWNSLKKALANLEAENLVVLERLPHPTTHRELQKRLRRGDDIHVFHFVGHGGFLDVERQEDLTLEKGAIVFEDESGKGRRIEAGKLASLLRVHRSLRLVVLNACKGARTSRHDAFAGTAQSLVLKDIPAVVAMRTEVSDKTARTFAEDFYSALVDGQPVDGCVSEARMSLYNDENPEWGTPILYLRATDGRLFKFEAKDQDA